MAQVAGRFDENNMGSKQVTHGKAMELKSNTKGVPVVSTNYSGKPVDPMEHRVESGHLPKDNK